MSSKRTYRQCNSDGDGNRRHIKIDSSQGRDALSNDDDVIVQRVAVKDNYVRHIQRISGPNDGGRYDFIRVRRSSNYTDTGDVINFGGDVFDSSEGTALEMYEDNMGRQLLRVIECTPPRIQSPLSSPSCSFTDVPNVTTSPSTEITTSTSSSQYSYSHRLSKFRWRGNAKETSKNSRGRSEFSMSKDCDSSSATSTTSTTANTSPTSIGKKRLGRKRGIRWYSQDPKV